jgi:signal transduction histidine kinase
MNLIGNAIKYSGSTSRVQVEVDRDSEHVILRIIDEGIGIPPDDIAHLFNAFYRASNVGTIPGTGLGLAIVRRAVDAHGGAIEVTSQVDRGTTFTVLLPQDGEKQQGADLSRPAP